MRKKCSKCRRVRRLKFFGTDSRYRMGVKGWCKSCEREYSNTPKAKKRRQKKWAENMKNPEFREVHRIRSKEKYHRNPRKQKDRIYKKKYGVSLNRFEKARRCSLCKQKRKLVPDHNHETGEYRGPLCYRCNLAISQAEKYAGWLKKVAEYLGRK